MVWFQCEDCGENLKKPKLPNHFRMCSATKLSCIDCGVMFGQESVQSHTQCITEAEKYGPKGPGKVSNGATPKQNKDAKKGPDVDINVGLSQRPPWFCSLCNTKATSQQALLLHADGKKHRAKARAIQATRQQPKQAQESNQSATVPIGSQTKCELSETAAKEQKGQDTPKAGDVHTNSDAENGKLSSKKRKLDASGKEVGDGKTPVEGSTEEEKDVQVKKAKADVIQDQTATEPGSMKEDTKRNIKWKKLIKSALKSNDGALKLKKLKKVVLKSLQESGITEDKTQLSNLLEHKINSSSKFKVDGEYVCLVAADCS